MEQAAEPRKKRWIVILLWLVPLWLVLSAGVGIWLYLRSSDQQAHKEEHRYVTKISESMIADDLKKLSKVVGPRTPSIDAGKGLTRAASWISGMLGPSNTGYTVKQLEGPAQWPLLRIDLPGKSSSSPAVWVITSYDSDGDTPTSDPYANAVIALVSTAQEMAGDSLERPVKFIFFPHGNDMTSPDLVSNTRHRLLDLIQDEKAYAILCIDDLSKGSELVLSSHQTENPVFHHLGDLGKNVTSDDTHPLESTLITEALPAVTIATTHASSSPTKDLTVVTECLVELVRRTAGKK